MKLPAKPNLKAPDVKVPSFISDVFWDLHDRRLLPLVALIVAAIVAVPFLLSGDPEEAPQGPPPAAATLKREIANASSLTVVPADPGLRDYRKRLADHQPANPFKPKFTAKKSKDAQLPDPEEQASSGAPTVSVGGEDDSGGGGSTGESGSTGSKPPSSGGGGSGGGSKGGGGSGGGGSGGDTGKTPHLTFFTYAINVRISRSGGKEKGSGGKEKTKQKQKKQEPIVRRRVLPQTMLPGAKAPVVTYLGPARKGRKATGKVLLMVSEKVKSVFGDSRCVVGEEVCQLLEVEPGFPVTLIYGANEVRYTINVLKLELIVTGRS